MQTDNAYKEINDAVAEFITKFDQLSSDYMAKLITTTQYDQRGRQLHQEFVEKLDLGRAVANRRLGIWTGPPASAA